MRAVFYRIDTGFLYGRIRTYSSSIPNSKTQNLQRSMYSVHHTVQCRSIAFVITLLFNYTVQYFDHMQCLGFVPVCVWKIRISGIQPFYIRYPAKYLMMFSAGYQIQPPAGYLHRYPIYERVFSKISGIRPNIEFNIRPDIC